MFENTETFKRYKLASTSDKKSPQITLFSKLDNISGQLDGVRGVLSNIYEDRVWQNKERKRNAQSKNTKPILIVVVLILIIQILFVLKYVF